MIRKGREKEDKNRIIRRCMMEEELVFEEAIKRLEEIVSSLENGQLPLDESLKMFEEGVRLSRLCNKKLMDTQQKVEKLVEKDKDITTEPMDGD